MILSWNILYVFVVIFDVSVSLFNPTTPKLGIDYGPRLIGLAISNRLGTVNPYLTIPNHRNLTEVSLEIADIVNTRAINDVILGIPLDSNGKLSYKIRNFNGNLCLDFSKVLSTIIKDKCPQATVYLVDERYSTREAKARLKYEKIKASIDAMSAACLVERYIEDEGEYCITAESCGYPIPEELEILDYSKVSEYVRDSKMQDLSPMDIAKQRMKDLKKGRQPRDYDF